MTLLSKKKDKAVIGSVLDNLITYYRAHFYREEQEMLRVNYPGYALHEKEHEKFIAEVNQLKKSFDKGVPISAAYVGTMLSDWLRKHIATVDIKLAEALKKQP